jgi:hypothetical protein
MALLDDILEGGNLMTGLAIGVGALIAWPLISPIARPLAKSIIKGGLIAYRQAEQLYAGAVEGIGDIVAEAQQEVGATTPVKSDTGRRTSRVSRTTDDDKRN